MLKFGKVGHLVPPVNSLKLDEMLPVLMTGPKQCAPVGLALQEGVDIFDVRRLAPNGAAVYRDAMTARSVAL